MACGSISDARERMILWVHLSLPPLKLRRQLSDRKDAEKRTWTEQIMLSVHIICLPGITQRRENWGRDEKNPWLAANPSSVRCSSILAVSLYLAPPPPPSSGQPGPSATGNKWPGPISQRLSASCCHTSKGRNLEKHLRGIVVVTTTFQ